MNPSKNSQTVTTIYMLIVLYFGAGLHRDGSSLQPPFSLHLGWRSGGARTSEVATRMLAGKVLAYFTSVRGLAVPDGIARLSPKSFSTSPSSVYQVALLRHHVGGHDH